MGGRAVRSETCSSLRVFFPSFSPLQSHFPINFRRIWGKNWQVIVAEITPTGNSATLWLSDDMMVLVAGFYSLNIAQYSYWLGLFPLWMVLWSFESYGAVRWALDFARILFDSVFRLTQFSFTVAMECEREVLRVQKKLDKIIEKGSVIWNGNEDLRALPPPYK